MKAFAQQLLRPDGQLSTIEDGVSDDSRFELGIRAVYFLTKYSKMSAYEHVGGGLKIKGVEKKWDIDWLLSPDGRRSKKKKQLEKQQESIEQGLQQVAGSFRG